MQCPQTPAFSLSCGCSWVLQRMGCPVIIRLAKPLPRTAPFHALFRTTLSCLLGIVRRKPQQSYRITGGAARATLSVSQSCVSRPGQENENGEDFVCVMTAAGIVLLLATNCCTRHRYRRRPVADFELCQNFLNMRTWHLRSIAHNRSSKTCQDSRALIGFIPGKSPTR